MSRATLFTTIDNNLILVTEYNSIKIENNKIKVFFGNLTEIEPDNSNSIIQENRATKEFNLKNIKYKDSRIDEILIQEYQVKENTIIYTTNKNNVQDHLPESFNLYHKKSNFLELTKFNVHV
jgi:hypothetical protein